MRPYVGEIRKMAMDIVIREEQRNGWSPCAIGAAKGEKEHGCDILSGPPSGGKPHLVEVKGWGERFRGPSGKFLYAQDAPKAEGSRKLLSQTSGDDVEMGERRCPR